MILAIGVDAIEVARIEKAMQKPRFVERILTERERSQIRTPIRIAGRWAAKEAIYKCLPHLNRWHAIEILSSPAGQPIATVDLPPGTKLHLTITHEKNVAIAVAILESNDERIGS